MLFPLPQSGDASIVRGAFANGSRFSIEVAAHECVSEEALVHLKSYKYSSVDKSLISNYILKHYV
jgi:hypothetical protein